jgi:PKD repeat protein
MDKIFTKSIFLLSLFTLFAFKSLVAQTITVSAVDPGPYGPGSTIAVPFEINDAGGCIATNNVFNLYLCNAAGTVISNTPVSTVTAFYAAFLNYTVPAGTPAGTYTLRVKSTSPVVTSAQSNTFTISAGAGSTASLTCPSSQIGNANYPQVFGTCSGVNNTTYTFDNTSAAGSTATISFFNELSQTAEVSNAPFVTNFYNFTAKAANYTVTVKAVNAGGIVSTYAYQLINNVVNTSIGATGNQTACLSGGSAPLTYNIDVSSPTGIQNNYPGNTYIFSWGDGSPNSIYTLCQIQALNGEITHSFTGSSCGITSNNRPNSFEVDFQADNTYCGKIGSAPSNYAKVFPYPTDSFSGPVTACTGTMVSFINTSNPGPNQNANTSSCAPNPNATYSWSVDGKIVESGYLLNKNFVYAFSEGTHMVTLHLENPGSCPPTDAQQTICIQNAPQPSFTMPVTSICLGSGPVTPINSSIVDATCNTNNTYTWSVSPSTGVTFNANSATPQFAFSTPGVYTISLSITTASCGTVADLNTATIVVNQTPTAKLSADFSSCGTGQTFNFNSTSTNNPTYTQLSGTSQAQTNTYTWSVTGGTYSYVGGTTASSQYPEIVFNDFATYTISVTQQNNCGVATSTQHITFQPSPTVSASSNGVTNVCAGNSISLQGTVGPGVTSYQWVGGTGTFTPNATSLNTVYQPSNADIAAGQVTLTLEANTTLAAPCNQVTSSVTVSITPSDVITSSLTKTTCSKQSVAYTITAQAAASTFTWTASLVSGSATGFSPTGTTSFINDVITNTDPAASTNAVVAYVITPYNSNGCAGTPSTLTVTITPLPLLTATPANAEICSGETSGISLSTALNGVTYTWTSTATGSAAGNTSNSVPQSITAIQDVLTNTGTTTATVTYIITPYNSDGCGGTAVTVAITVQPQPVTANAGSPISLCGGTSTQLNGNSPSPGTGLWQVVSGNGTTFSDPTSPTTTVSGLVPGNTYQFSWTITAAPGCSSPSSTVTVTDNAPTVPGITVSTGPTTVCAGSNSGQINLSGQTGQVVNWQSSVDNGATFQPLNPVNTTGTLTFTNLSQTTEYEAIVQNGSCGSLTSTPTTITVNQPAIIANAGLPATLCGAATYTLQGNDPGIYQGLWTQLSGPAATIVNPTQYNTVVNNLQQGNTYVFQWEIMAVAPCANSTSTVTITDNGDVIASFTASNNNNPLCGTQAVQFINTSNNQTGAQFLWDFGDGSPTSTEVSPTHIFQENPTGSDIKYTVTLSVLNNCAVQQPYSQDIIVKPSKPVASIQLQNPSGCSSPYQITVLNLSPGDDLSYEFYLYLGTQKIQEKPGALDKSSVTFDPITVTAPTQYKVYMVATSTCGSATSVVIPITITPPTVFPNVFELNGISTGCAPLSVTLVNNSVGGSGYVYNIYNSSSSTVPIAQIPAGLGDFPYTFTNPGTYYVSVTASNNCNTGIESAKYKFDVYPDPVPGFTLTTDCSNNVTFTNTTQDNGTTPAGSLNYLWDFGDGTTSTSFSPPPHLYNYENSPFTVTLTATNPFSNCAGIFTQSISIQAPLVAAFTEFPNGVATIPNYHFSFTDQSTGKPVSWVWAFGDGSTSTSQNPTHTYADTGAYIVTLTITNANGCISTVTNKVSITGTPGQLFLPNAFIPGSATTELRVFMAKGSGIKNWLMQIFNNYGQLIFQTTRLDSKGAPVDGWDGTFKGAPMPQGSYTWQVSATFINGTQWKGMSYNGGLPQRTGSVNLIR